MILNDSKMIINDEKTLKNFLKNDIKWDRITIKVYKMILNYI